MKIEISKEFAKELKAFQERKAAFHKAFGEDNYVTLRNAHREAEKQLQTLEHRLQTEDVLEEWRACKARMESCDRDWWSCEDAWYDLNEQAKGLAQRFLFEFANVQDSRPIGGPRRQTEIGEGKDLFPAPGVSPQS